MKIWHHWGYSKNRLWVLKGKSRRKVQRWLKQWSGINALPPRRLFKWDQSHLNAEFLVWEISFPLLANYTHIFLGMSSLKSIVRGLINVQSVGYRELWAIENSVIGERQWIGGISDSFLGLWKWSFPILSLGFPIALLWSGRPCLCKETKFKMKSLNSGDRLFITDNLYFVTYDLIVSKMIAKWACYN